MAIKVRARSLSQVSEILALGFANAAYKAFRPIGTKHHWNQPVYNLRRKCRWAVLKIDLQLSRDKSMDMSCVAGRF